ncbi:hypothetical protein [Gordonia sp. OPL2]|uniref:hypothetical protein n=1 Tax=Gordonia sp. OPL2 TaxID=2486274 RepID=UPI0016561D97|nr:hypothetical protein [Gordonia sp. OPL2]ROZ88008.1 hypothetical protein EEB19_22635 [Gordonia sp. OPL2]
MTFFGRAGGPMRMVWAAVMLMVLLLLSFVIYTLNGRLDNQQAANLASIGASGRIVTVNDSVTTELGQLTELTRTAQRALDSTRALGPLLAELNTAIGEATALLESSTQGAQVTNEQLTGIQSLMVRVKQTVTPLVASAAAFGEQGDQLLATARGLVTDLRSAVASARTINQMLPLPG